MAHYAKIIVVIHSVLLTYVAAHLLQESKATKAVKAVRGGRGGRRGRGRDDGIAPRCHPLSGDQSHPLPTSDDRHKEKKVSFSPPSPPILLEARVLRSLYTFLVSFFLQLRKVRERK